MAALAGKQALADRLPQDLRRRWRQRTHSRGIGPRRPRRCVSLLGAKILQDARLAGVTIDDIAIAASLLWGDERARKGPAGQPSDHKSIIDINGGRHFELGIQGSNEVKRSREAESIVPAG